MDVCDEHQKESKLARLLEEIGDEKIIVFTETKRKCDELTRFGCIFSFRSLSGKMRAE